MNRRIFALLCAVVLLLSGCANQPDDGLSQQFPEQFRYCFGSDFENTLIASETDAAGTVTETRALRYTDADGTQRTCEYEIVQREAGAYALSELRSLCQRASQMPFMAEFSESILPKAFDEQYRTDDWSIRFSEREDPNLYGSVEGVWAAASERFSLSAADLKTLGCACRAYGADLNALAKNPFFLLHVTLEAVGAVSDQRAAHCREQLETLCAEYTGDAGGAQNYLFEFRPADTDAEPFCIAVLLGKPFAGAAEELLPMLEQQLSVRYPLTT